MKLLDTNVIIYATGRPHPYKTACGNLLRDASDKPGDYNIDTELLQEILHVYKSRSELARGLETFDDLLRLFPSPLIVGLGEVLTSRRLLEQYPRLSSRDAIHAAVVLNYRLEGIVSADQIFDDVSAMKRFDPLEIYPP